LLKNPLSVARQDKTEFYPTRKSPDLPSGSFNKLLTKEIGSLPAPYLGY